MLYHLVRSEAPSAGAGAGHRAGNRRAGFGGGWGRTPRWNRSGFLRAGSVPVAGRPACWRRYRRRVGRMSRWNRSGFLRAGWGRSCPGRPVRLGSAVGRLPPNDNRRPRVGGGGCGCGRVGQFCGSGSTLGFCPGLKFGSHSVSGTVGAVVGAVGGGAIEGAVTVMPMPHGFCAPVGGSFGVGGCDRKISEDYP